MNEKSRATSAGRRGAAIGVMIAMLGLGAREGRADVQMWTEAGVEKPIKKRVDVVVSVDVRFDQDVSRLESFLPEGWLFLRLQKWFRLGGGYRLGFTRDGNGDMVIRHRVMGGAQLKTDLGDLRFAYAGRYEIEIRPSSNNSVRNRLRNKVGLSYRGSKKWIPGVAVELFHPIENSTIFWDKTRLTFGVDYAAKDYEVGGFYRIEDFHADPMTPTNHIIGADFRYEL